MRYFVVSILVLSALSPLLITPTPLEPSTPWFTEEGGVEIINEIEPNNVNTSGQEVYPGDVVRGSVDMWDDEHDWYSVWLEAGQTLLLTLSHAAGDGVSISVWDEENTHHGSSNPGKMRDTIFLDEDATEVGGVYSVSINATMTEAGGGAYVLEIDAGYMVQWYSPEVGWYVAADTYDAKGNVMYTSTLSSYQFTESASTDDQSAPVWTNGDYWNFSVSIPEFFGVTYDEYQQLTVTGIDTVSGKDCYRVSIEGKATLTMNMEGVQMKTIDEESGVACYAIDTLSMVHENISMSSSIETSGGLGAMMDDTSGRSCTDEWGDPDSDCDGVSDDWDDCPGTASGAEVDDWGCSDEQNGSGNGGGDNNTNNCPNDSDCDGLTDIEENDYYGTDPYDNDTDGDGLEDGYEVENGLDPHDGGSGGGGSSIDDGCIPSGIDQKTVIKSDLTYTNGMNQFNFPLVEGKVWSEASVSTGTIALSIEMGGCSMLDIELNGSDALPLNYRHLGTESFTVGQSTVSANGIQSFSGREGNNDWATPDFTILPSVPDDVARMGLPFAVWINVVGFNEFNSSVDVSANINSQNAPLMYDNQQLTIDDLGAVIVDTMNLSSGEYELTITGSNGGRDRSITVPFTVDNEPDFEVLTMDPWIVLPGGVPWVVPTPIFIEPVNGFGADVILSAVVPEGVTAELDFVQGSAPFMAILTLTLSDNLTEGDYTVVISGTSGSTVRSDEITFTITSLPEFSLDIENREQVLVDGTMSISGVINAHNGLDLTLGGVLDVLVEPYNQALLDSAVITWGEVDSNGDLSFTVTFTVDENIPRNEYTIQLNVVTLDGGIAHAASVAFVTESSTLDGTAVAADSSSVVSGDTEQHDGTNNSAEDHNSDADSNLTSSESIVEPKSSNTGLIVGSTIGILGVIIGIAFVVLRGRNGENTGANLAQQSWAEPQQPIVQQPVSSTHAPPGQMMTAPPPPAQPTTVPDYTGLPPGGQYDQSTGQTVYVQADGIRWQQMPDGSFNRLN
ncbi:MAG: hypothetical protein CMB49_06815 [Euryarchaeota archaeon]|nr:hypothetical protein [Euryarchaeota archaeon]